MKTFQNYHCHKEYTNVRISDSVTHLTQYAARATALGHTILSSMEHGWQGNYYETVKIAKQCGLKPLIGAEAYWVKNRLEKDRTNCHIYLAAKNEYGRQALNDALSEANLTGFYGQPRLDIPLILSLPARDIIATTACVAYWQYNDIDTITRTFAEHFGKNFYLEVQYHNTAAQRQLNKRILKLHNDLKIPLIMGCDSHFIAKDQGQTRTDFLISKGITYPEEDGWFLDYPDGDTAYQRFAEQCILSHSEICDAMDNTNVFLDINEYDSPVFSSEIKMPSLFPSFSQQQKNEEYKKLVWNGWNDYKINVPSEQHSLYKDEIKKEIKTVEDTRMADYFIDNYHIIRKGKENGGWLTKTGRGSAVSYITNMLLGFTEVDRIAAKIHMYPERFMSTTRILQSGSLPDIDFNCAPVEPFAKAQKDVLGEDHAYPMISYGTMQKSAAWKLYAKSQGIPFEIANAISEQIRKYEVALKHADEENKNDINIIDYIDSEYKEIYEKSKDYLGVITSWSIAPCSYLLYQGSIRREIGLVKIKDHICCLMDGHWAEECHFLKNDLLKVSVVDLIYRAYHRIGKEPPSVSELLKSCPPDDSAWKIYENGCTLGINQCEQNGTAARVAKYKPKNISELGAFVAAIRPGFKSMYKTFESRKPFAYGVKAFDDLIQTDEMPNSFLIYQEQEMTALNYAGIDMSDCYTAIKNIAKKRTDKVLAYKDKFISGFSKSIIQENRSAEEADALAQKLWQIIEDSASYSFNASHAYCVALDSLYGAWLKAHHPLEFYEILLTISEQKGDKDKMRALKEEAESFFGIHFPPFRFGQDNSSIKADIKNNQISNSLASIKGYSPTIATKLYECSQNNFNRFVDILDHLDQFSIKASKIQPLIQIDYFQKFGNINTLLHLLDAWELLKQGKAKTLRKEKIDFAPLFKILESACLASNKDGSDSTSFKIGESAKKYLYALEDFLMQHPLPDFSMHLKLKYSMDILGYVDVVTNQEIDRRRLLITDRTPLENSNGSIWAYRIGTQSLGTGKTARLTIKANTFNAHPIAPGDILYATELWKNESGYWYLLSYNIETK